MVLSYVLVCISIYTLIILPQNKLLHQYRAEKADVEYTYMKVTSSPAFLKSIDETVKDVSGKTTHFLWLDSSGTDVGLTFYNYLYKLAVKNNVDILEITMQENQGKKKTKEERLYYKWKVKVTGRFPDIVNFINDMEQKENFLIVKDIKINKTRIMDNTITVYEMVVLGIKKEGLNENKNGKS